MTSREFLPPWARQPVFFTPAEAAASYFDGITGDLASKDVRVDGTSPGCLAECYAAAFEKFAPRPCLGRRPFQGAPFEWISYADFDSEARAVAAGLRGRVPEGGRVGICGCNSYEWVLMDFACLFAGAPSVVFSETWDVACLSAVAQHAMVCAIATDGTSASRVFEALKSCAQPQLAITMNRVPDHAWPPPQSVRLQDLLMTAPIEKVVHRKPDDLHTIFHTSGTTGLPKGVVYSDKLWDKNMVHYSQQLMVSAPYQPFGFITDRHLLHTTLWNGGRAGLIYYHEGCSKMEDILGDMKAVRPTILKAVPKFLEQIHVAARSEQDMHLRILGGRLQLLTCGGGALDPKVANWFAGLESQYEPSLKAGSAPKPLVMLYKYGSTEAGNLADERHMRKTVEWKLLPCDGFNIAEGYGELVVKTPDMFGGYDDDEAKTKAAFTDDGFFKMGDIVKITRLDSDGKVAAIPESWDPSKSIKGERDATVLSNVLVDVMGRAGSSIKLQNGKWVAVEALEDFYRSATPGMNFVMLYGDLSHDQIVALVDPESKTTESIALEKLQRVGHEHKKPYYEIPAGVVVAKTPFTRENSCLNGTYKLNRRYLQKEFKADFDALFKELAEHGSDPLKGYDATKTFQHQGGTSIKANEIVNLYAKLGVPRDEVLASLFPKEGERAKPIEEVKQQLKRVKTPVRPEERELPDFCSADLALPASSKENAVPKAVFVTGATGFLGPFIVRDLLLKGRRVICLVRGTNDTAARERLMHQLQSSGLLKTKNDLDLKLDCLEVRSGSLGAPYFGLQEQDFDTIAARVDSILHLAAEVNLRGDYAKHERTNVDGTIEVLRLAFRAQARMIFASTTDVLPPGWGDEEPPPSDLQLPDNPLKDGYKTSKIIGERFVDAARRRGLKSAIVRLGFIGGDSVTGICNARDEICRYLIGFAHTRAFPETTDQTFIRFLPVNVASKALHQLLDSDFQGVVHLTSGAPDLPLNEDLRMILLRFGAPYKALPLVPFPDWMDRAELDGAQTVWPIISWAKGKEEFPKFNSKSVRPTTILTLVDESTQAEIKSDLEQVGETLMKMVKYIFHADTSTNTSTTTRANTGANTITTRTASSSSSSNKVQTDLPTGF